MPLPPVSLGQLTDNPRYQEADLEGRLTAVGRWFDQYEEGLGKSLEIPDNPSPAMEQARVRRNQVTTLETLRWNRDHGNAFDRQASDLEIKALGNLIGVTSAAKSDEEIKEASNVYAQELLDITGARNAAQIRHEDRLARAEAVTESAKERTVLDVMSGNPVRTSLDWAKQGFQSEEEYRVAKRDADIASQKFGGPAAVDSTGRVFVNHQALATDLNGVADAVRDLDAPAEEKRRVWNSLPALRERIGKNYAKEFNKSAAARAALPEGAEKFDGEMALEALRTNPKLVAAIGGVTRGSLRMIETIPNMAIMLAGDATHPATVAWARQIREERSAIESLASGTGLTGSLGGTVAFEAAAALPELVPIAKAAKGAQALFQTVKAKRLAGVSAAVATGSAFSGNAAFSESISLGEPINKARAAYLIQFGTTLLASGSFSAIGLGGIESALAGARSSAARTTLLKKLGKIGIQGTSEGLEEGIDEYAANLAIAYKNRREGATHEELAHQALVAMLVGGLVGSGVEAAAEAAQAAEKPADDSPVLDPAAVAVRRDGSDVAALQKVIDEGGLDEETKAQLEEAKAELLTQEEPPPAPEEESAPAPAAYENPDLSPEEQIELIGERIVELEAREEAGDLGEEETTELNMLQSILDEYEEEASAQPEPEDVPAEPEPAPEPAPEPLPTPEPEPAPSEPPVEPEEEEDPRWARLRDLDGKRVVLPEFGAVTVSVDDQIATLSVAESDARGKQLSEVGRVYRDVSKQSESAAVGSMVLERALLEAAANDAKPTPKKKPRRIKVKPSDVREETTTYENHPVLFAIREDHGRMESKTAALKRVGKDPEARKRIAGLYDGAPDRDPGLAKMIYGGTLSPDQLAEAMFGDGDPAPMWEAINKARTDVKSGAQVAKAQAAKIETRVDFEEAATTEDPGETAIDPSELVAGAKLTLDGEEFEVLKVITDEDGYPEEIVLKDGPRFGRQTVEPGFTMFVETLEFPETAEFAPDDDPFALEPQADLEASDVPGRGTVNDYLEQAGLDPQDSSVDDAIFDTYNETEQSINEARSPDEQRKTPQPKKFEEEGRIYVSNQEAEKRLAEWKLIAKKDGESGRNSGKVVLSLFDTSGVISKPWREAGYDVYSFDLDEESLVAWQEDIQGMTAKWLQDNGLDDVEVVLAQPPCTDFACSGARWFAKKDADGRTKASVELAGHTLAMIGFLRPHLWALENPIGRINKLLGMPNPRLVFDPFMYGDPYTKRTQLFGEFSANLPEAPVAPTEGSKIHKLRGDDPKQKKERSLTPESFAYSFYVANREYNKTFAAKVAEKVEGATPTSSPGFHLEPQTEEDIKREQEEAKLKEKKKEMLAAAAAPLTGGTGDLTADMFGEGETPLFNERRNSDADTVTPPKKKSGQAGADVADSDSAVATPGARPGLANIAKTEEAKALLFSKTTAVGFPSEVRALSNMALSRLLRLLDVPLLAASIKRGGKLGEAISQIVNNSKHPVAVRLRAKIFQFPELARMVLAHEIGHIVDYVAANVKGPGLARRLSPLGKSHYAAVFPFLDKLPKTKKGEPNLNELEAVIRSELRALSQLWRGSYNPSAEAYRDSAPELYADFLSAMMNDPAWVLQTAPLSYGAFSTAINQKPDFAKAWDTLQSMIENETLAEAAASDIESDRKQAAVKLLEDAERKKAERKEKKKRWLEWMEVNINRHARAAKLDPERADKLESVQQWEQFMRANWNRFLEFHVDRPLSDHGIGPDIFQRYQIATRIVYESSATLDFIKKNPQEVREMMEWVFEKMDGTIAEGWAEHWSEEIGDATDEELYKVLARASFDLQMIKGDIDEILDRLAAFDKQDFPVKFKEFFEAWNVRGFLANPNGITPDDALADLKNIESDLGTEKYEVLQNTAKNLSIRFYNLMQGAHRLGLIADDVFMEKIRPNAGVYVPFQVAAYFMPSDLRAGIFKQHGTDKGIVDATTVMNIQAHKWITRMARQKEAGLLKDIAQVSNLPVQVAKLSKYKQRTNQPNEVIWFSGGKAHSVVFPEGAMRHAVETYNRVREISSDPLLRGVINVTGYYRQIWTKFSLGFTLFRSPVREVRNVYNRGGMRGVSELGKLDNMQDALNYAMAVAGVADLNRANKKRVHDTRLLDPKEYRHAKFNDSPYRAALREDASIEQMFAEAHATGLMRLRPLLPSSSLKAFDLMMGALSGVSLGLDGIAAATDAISKIATEQNLNWINERRKSKGKKELTEAQITKLVKFTALPNPGAEGGTAVTRKALIPFYRTGWQGFRAMAVWARTDRNIGMGYVMRTTFSTLLPKTLMWAAASGVLRELLKDMFGEEGDDIGSGLQKFFAYLPEYQKATEFIVPLMWVDETGEVRGLGTPGDQIGTDWTPVGIRIVASDESRALGPVVWATMKKMSPNTNDHAFFRDMASTALSNVPGASVIEQGMGNPALGAIWDAALISTGGNPPDFYRRKGKFRDDEEFRTNPWWVYFKNLIGESNPVLNPDVQMKKGSPAESVSFLRRLKPVTGIFSITGGGSNEAAMFKKIKDDEVQRSKDLAKLAIREVSKPAFEFLKAGSSARNKAKDERTTKEKMMAKLYSSFEANYWSPRDTSRGPRFGAQDHLIDAIEKGDKERAKRIASEAAAYLSRQKAMLDQVR